MSFEKDQQPLKDAEVEAESHAEADDEARAIDPQGGQLEDEEQLDATAEQAITNTEAEVPAELAAVHTDNATAQAVSKPNKKPAKTKEKSRSQKYEQAASKVNQKKSYSLDEAIKLAKESSYAKFDASVEIHVRLSPKKGEKTDSIRGLIQLPHGSPKQTNVKVLTEDLIEEISRTKKVDADILIASPALMPKVAKIAKILGPIGKMPSPKAGTVSDKPEDVVKSIEAGRVEYRADNQAIVHLAIGKASWEDAKLKDNCLAVIGALPKTQLLSVNISATMGPGIKVDSNSL